MNALRRLLDSNICTITPLKTGRRDSGSLARCEVTVSMATRIKTNSSQQVYTCVEIMYKYPFVLDAVLGYSEKGNEADD